MSDDKQGQKNYVYRVLDDTTSYVQALLGDNEKLRQLLGSMKDEKDQAEQQLLMIDGELKRVREEKSRLEQELAQIESEKRQFSGRYIEVEQQNAKSLLNLMSFFRIEETTHAAFRLPQTSRPLHHNGHAQAVARSAFARASAERNGHGTARPVEEPEFRHF
ncbi:MAG TPA: hypothetical protein VJ464_22890 [Blastocatellia bacterium]|nr:hypothetical protein [Blastocatellia bacterium]